MDSVDSSAKPKFSTKTFGCKVNSYDTGLLERKFNSEGFQHADSKKASPDVFILNTCAVTGEASKEAVRAVRKIKSQTPQAKIVITGCSAQVDTDLFSNLPGVDLVVANSHKAQIEHLVGDLLKGKLSQKTYKSNIFKMEDLGLGGGVSSQHTRSFLKIQDGCNSFCTFCIIPFARGKSRSLPPEALIDKINELESKGVQEVVLTGVHIGDYEYEGLKIEDLLELILNQTSIPRIRLTSLEPIEISNRLFQLFSHEQMCPHFHISLQSAQSRVLKTMKRNYGAEDVEAALEKIYQLYPDAFVGMDIIAGFPGETDKEFEETVNRMQRLPWARMHVFPYSPRPGVYANRIQDQWPRSLIMERAKILRDISRDRLKSSAKLQLGEIKSVLGLGGKSQGRGLARDFWKVQIDGDVLLPKNKESLVRIVGFEELGGEDILLKGTLV